MKTNRFYFTALAAFLAVACGKTSPVEEQLEEPVFANFSVNLDEPSKAAIDGDGAAANVDRCKLQIWIGDEIYKTVVKTADPGTKSYDFKDIPLLPGQVYDFLFWADCSNEGGDQYYNTKTLRDVQLMQKELGNQDAIDAFCNQPDEELSYTSRLIGQTISENFTKTVILKRPLAQLNVITNDLSLIASTEMAESLKPNSVTYSYKGCTNFNVRTNKFSNAATITVTAVPIYNEKTGTLAMNYILPFDGNQLSYVDFVTTCVGGIKITNHWDNIPFKRNWRTNIQGGILTRNGNFLVTVSPIWEGDINISK